MKLTPIAANRNIVSYDDGTEVFFSYSTPVAGYSPALGYVKTANWYSSTTTRHINKYLGVIKADEVPQEIINNLLIYTYKMCIKSVISRIFIFIDMPSCC